MGNPINVITENRKTAEKVNRKRFKPSQLLIITWEKWRLNHQRYPRQAEKLVKVRKGKNLLSQKTAKKRKRKKYPNSPNLIKNKNCISGHKKTLVEKIPKENQHH